MGRELRALGGNYYGGVCVNLAPNPKWGRAQESYGEDPLLIGTLGAALSRGVQENAIACVKHFALNSMENQRFQVDVRCAPETLHECFFPHFRQCLMEGGAESVMSAYNSVNGEYAGDNAELLNGVLRDTWGLEDVVVTSDWLWGTRDATKSIKAGLDIEMPLRSNRAVHLRRALEKGHVDWADVERIGKRILRLQLGYYARMAGNEAPSVAVAGSAEHRDLARRVATQGFVLLKNSVEGQPILPLEPQGQHILVIGQLAASTQTGDDGSSYVPDPNIISPLAGLQSQAGVTITYITGDDLSKVERACAKADVIFVLVGYTGADEGEFVANFEPIGMAASLPYVAPYIGVAHALSWLANKVIGVMGMLKGGIAGGDRKSLRLKPVDEQLLNTIVDVAGPKTIVGVEASGPVILPKGVRERAAAILMTGYGGCQFGNALRQVFFGEAEPAGRLAYNIVESELDIADIDMNATSVVYGRFWGYRLLQQKEKKAAYPFGFGLGYGDIVFEDLQAPTVLSERFFDARVKITNNGHHTSSGVVQIYAGKSSPSADDYARVLVGFARTEPLAPGDSTTVLIHCRLDPVARWNNSNKCFSVPTGKYNILASRYEGDPESVVKAVSLGQVGWGVNAGKE